MICRTVLLPLSPERSFKLFTERVGAWWPPGRRHLGDPNSQLFLQESGRFYERASDGREVELGRVQVWEPPTQLILDFYPGTSAAQPTEVTVRFVPEGEGTRVVVEHRPTAASEAIWHSRAPKFAASWELVLPALEAYVASL